MKRVKRIALTVVGVVFVAGVFIAYSWIMTESDISRHRKRVTAIASTAPSPSYDAAKIMALPNPVKRYFAFAFGGDIKPKPIKLIEMRMNGYFRRPLTESFAPTTAEQTIAAGRPAFVFSATTPIAPGVWARAYDAFADAQMEMKAKIMSTLTVVNEKETPALNKTSLRRWLIESTICPTALLPGGPVSWEPIDDSRARMVVSVGELEASLVATFGPDGRLERLDAEEDGDLTTPYHGSGEHVLRGDYQMISGMMIPHTFTIARASGAKILPFWKGRITLIKIDDFE
jgi:hypothetical protein